MTRLSLVVALCCCLGACGGDGDASSGTLDRGPAAFDPDFRSSATFFTRMSEPMTGLSTSPHGVVQIFYSRNIEPVIERDSFSAPEGTVAIKTQDSDADGDVDNIMVMIKNVRGFDASTRDWLYERYRGNGRLDVSGGATLEFCSGCHNAYPATAELAGTRLHD